MAVIGAASKTLFGIKYETERAVLVLWSIIVFLSSLIGDSIILVATIKYRAIKQHSVIIAIIQHMAVSDLLQALFRVFPITTALIEDRWVMDEVMCHIQDNVTWIASGMTMVLTCALTTFKLATVEYPIMTRTWTQKFGHKICAAVWLLVLCFYGPVLFGKLFFIRDTIHFSYDNYECSYLHDTISAPDWYRPFSIISFSSFSVLCYINLIVTSFLLILKAKTVRSRNGNTVRLEGLITVLLTVGIYLFSYLPFSVVFTTSLIGVNYGPMIWRFLTFMLYFNIIANFYIYCITIRSFRDFLKMKISRVMSSCKLSSENEIHPVRS